MSAPGDPLPATAGPLKVLFIGGPGRSGSTLLDRLLGRVRGMVSVGEITDIWRVGFREDFPCGCGEPFSRCPFWRRVVQDAFGPRPGSGLDTGLDLDLARVAALRREVQEGARRLQLLLPARPPAFARGLRAYAAVLERLLGAIARQSQASVVVDSSKLPAHGLVLAAIRSVELHVLHLVRDSRAVAFSWQRRKLRRTVCGRAEYLPRLGPLASAVRYYAGNVPLWRLRRRAASYTLLRYEDLVREPGQELTRILQAVGISGADLGFLQGRRADLGLCHMVDGNPMRMSQGPVQIRDDDQWRRGMDRRQRLLVELLTWPLLLRYGYLP